MRYEWTNIKLSEITSLITKGTTPTTIGYSFVEQGVNFVKSESITTSRSLDKNKYCHITEIVHEKLKRSQLQVNDILFSAPFIIYCVRATQLERNIFLSTNGIGGVEKAMERQAAAKIDQGIGKQEAPPEEVRETKHPTMTTFRADPGKRRKPGTGCVHQIGDHLWEGRYSPRGPDGKQRSRNVYGRTQEECEEKLKVLIETMKAEIQAERRQLREAENRP